MSQTRVITDCYGSPAIVIHNHGPEGALVACICPFPENRRRQCVCQVESELEKLVGLVDRVCEVQYAAIGSAEGDGMASRISSVPDSFEWKQAYLSAVLEKDRSCVVGLIEMAREKLALRQHELTVNGAVPCDEAKAIHDAYYLLEALQSTLPYRCDLGETSADAERSRQGLD